MEQTIFIILTKSHDPSWFFVVDHSQSVCIDALEHANALLSQVCKESSLFRPMCFLAANSHHHGFDFKLLHTFGKLTQVTPSTDLVTSFASLYSGEGLLGPAWYSKVIFGSSWILFMHQIRTADLTVFQSFLFPDKSKLRFLTLVFKSGHCSLNLASLSCFVILGQVCMVYPSSRLSEDFRLVIRSRWALTPILSDLRDYFSPFILSSVPKSTSIPPRESIATDF